MSPTTQLDADAITVAMVLVPGLYSRNRMFALFKEPTIRRARARAAVLRGIVRQLCGACGAVKNVELVRSSAGGRLRFEVESVRFVRHAQLSEVEAACVAYLAGRGNADGIVTSVSDRALVDEALGRLSGSLRLAAIEGDPSLPDSS